jgi:hypothetical protein
MNWPDVIGKITWSDTVGILGVAISVYYYARVQWHRDYAKTMAYSMGNLVGSLMIIYSLVYNWNIASFLCNSAWGVISLYGIYRCLKYSWLEKKAEGKVGYE